MMVGPAISAFTSVLKFSSAQKGAIRGKLEKEVGIFLIFLLTFLWFKKAIFYRLFSI